MVLVTVRAAVNLTMGHAKRRGETGLCRQQYGNAKRDIDRPSKPAGRQKDKPRMRLSSSQSQSLGHNGEVPRGL